MKTSLPQLERTAKTLAEKAEACVAFMRSMAELAAPEEIAVAWTGGKDSTVALALWRECLRSYAPGAPLRAVNIDTGCKFPEVIALRDEVARQWDVELVVARPEVELAGYPLAVDKVACCRDLKVRPLQRALAENGVRVLFTGIRADEHASRQERPCVERREHPEHLLAHPVLAFTEMDVWAYIIDKALPYCSLYADGYRSLGCMPCTRRSDASEPERAGRDQDKEAKLEMLHSLGYF
ncbi:phosphoadenosine phosphosulfate reductase [Desulfobaculum xiamenense]|uniref:Phosphoadenosine phosphosulfate reductase n=1 Tax=Desulfobaculum xiamenense TaxID=995050 RepID=A0A846QQD7_9BACT|nr:phosphoadenosine phosphosulfate reductase family protein [Desulfobaculum xiamenense]NJB69387.1 phosphoadenosine phosphosulfate reductase [Desulfobaculum xiamenense]